MVSSDLLQRTAKGKRIARGDTLGQPVELAGAKNDGRTLALFEDGRLRDLFERLSTSEDPYGVAQALLSELTNLYLERPDMLRACGALWPGDWRPSRKVLDEVARAITSAPWLKTVTLAECLAAVQPLETDPLDVPAVPPSDDEYFAQVGRARDHYRGFAQMVMPDNPILPTLSGNVNISESDVWRLWDRKLEGITYASSVVKTVDDEVDKIDLPPVGSITLTSGKAKIPLSVVNGTSYRISARLRLASNGLAFPDGQNEKVRLEPKENVLEIPVTVEKKGRVRFQARLETDSFVLGEVEFSVLTSRFNTFAILVVGGILAIIGAIWIFKIITRRKAGKHKRGNVQAGDDSSPQGAQAGA
jgi:hypothetical protein